MKKKRNKWWAGLCAFFMMLICCCACMIGGNTTSVYADELEAGQMTGTTGYFTIGIIGADGKKTEQKIEVTFPKGNDANGYTEEQEVTIKQPNKNKNNPHNLKVTGKYKASTSKTKAGKTPYPTKSKGYQHETNTMDGNCHVLMKDGTVKKYKNVKAEDIKNIVAYQEDAFTVFEVEVTYDKEAYTYPVAESVDNYENVRMNSYKYNWQNDYSENTLSKSVYHSTKTETFTLQINMAQTGVYRPGGVTKDYHAVYIVNLKHPTLEITYDGNGATSGSTAGTTHTISYNSSADPYNFSTFGLKKNGAVKNTGAEWNTKANGTGTAFDQAVDYPATTYKDFTDGDAFTTKKLTLYAQWKLKPTEFQIYLHANSPRGYVYQWYVGKSWMLVGQTAASTGQTYSGLYGDVTINKRYQMGKEYTLPQSTANLAVPGYTGIASGWYTEPAGGDYVANGKIKADALEEYINANGQVHLYALWTGNTHTLTFNPNGGTVGTSSVTIKYGTGDYNNVSWNIPTRDGYKFLGWYSAAADGTMVYDAAGACTNEGTYWSGNICVFDGDYTVYAHWEPSTYTVHFDGNGADSGTMSDMSCTYDTEYTLTPNAFKRTGYTFTGWNTATNGTGTAYKDKQSFKNLGDTTLYAQWKVNSYKVVLHSGNGIKSVSGAGTYPYNADVKISAEVETGYHWGKWTGTFEADKIEYTFRMPAQDVEMTADAEANEYIIHFDKNDGVEVSHLDDITVKYDEEITLPNITLADGTDAYVKYTLDGVNVTEQILDGRIVIDAKGRVLWQGEEALPEGTIVNEDGTITTPDGAVIMPDGTVIMPENVVESSSTSERETIEDTDNDKKKDDKEKEPKGSVEKKEVTKVKSQENEDIKLESDSKRATEEPETEPKADKKAYKSVFRGWSLEEERYSFIPQWEYDTMVKVKDIVNSAGVIDQNGAMITLYAVWDDSPWIHATNLYYTLEQAQNGFITADEILSHATAEDREDGSPIAPGVHDNGTSFTIPDYQPEDFTQFGHEGSCTENLTVVDSVGSKYVKQITVYIVDTTPTEVKPEGATRFITRNYYDKSYEYGGLQEKSIWKIDAEYRDTLLKAFDNIDNNTPIQTYVFSHEVIEAMKEYIETHGIGNTREWNALQNFYDCFMAPNQQ